MRRKGNVWEKQAEVRLPQGEHMKLLQKETVAAA